MSIRAIPFIYDFYGFRWLQQTFLLLPLQLFSQNNRTLWEKQHFNVKTICKYCLWSYVFIRTRLFLVNSCTYLEKFLVCVKRKTIKPTYLYLFCKWINKLFTKLSRYRLCAFFMFYRKKKPRMNMNVSVFARQL